MQKNEVRIDFFEPGSQYAIWFIFREKMELESKQKANQGGGNQLNACSPSNSRDSAIDTDMAEWEIETLEFSVVSFYFLKI